MIRMEIKSQVNLMGMKMTDTYIEEFDDDENIFGILLKYHERMNKTFPECEFKVISAEEINK